MLLVAVIRMFSEANGEGLLVVRTSPAQPIPVPPPQTPDVHISPVAHVLPSLQGDPSTTTGLVQAPVDGSQVPAEWHWSGAEQFT
jgi:hypothetical protein